MTIPNPNETMTRAKERMKTCLRLLVPMSSFVFCQRDNAGTAVHRDKLTTANALGRHARAEHGGDTIFARHDGPVTQRSADVGDDGCGHSEERRPGRRSDR